jgi:hypothetical protein
MKAIKFKQNDKLNCVYTGNKNNQYSFTFFRRVGFKPYPTEKRRVHFL